MVDTEPERLRPIERHKRRLKAMLISTPLYSSEMRRQGVQHDDDDDQNMETKSKRTRTQPHKTQANANYHLSFASRLVSLSAILVILWVNHFETLSWLMKSAIHKNEYIQFEGTILTKSHELVSKSIYMRDDLRCSLPADQVKYDDASSYVKLVAHSCGCLDVFQSSKPKSYLLYWLNDSCNNTVNNHDHDHDFNRLFIQANQRPTITMNHVSQSSSMRKRDLQADTSYLSSFSSSIDLLYAYSGLGSLGLIRWPEAGPALITLALAAEVGPKPTNKGTRDGSMVTDYNTIDGLIGIEDQIGSILATQLDPSHNAIEIEQSSGSSVSVWGSKARERPECKPEQNCDQVAESKQQILNKRQLTTSTSTSTATTTTTKTQQIISSQVNDNRGPKVRRNMFGLHQSGSNLLDELVSQSNGLIGPDELELLLEPDLFEGLNSMQLVERHADTGDSNHIRDEPSYEKSDAELESAPLSGFVGRQTVRRRAREGSFKFDASSSKDYAWSSVHEETESGPVDLDGDSGYDNKNKLETIYFAGFFPWLKDGLDVASQLDLSAPSEGSSKLDAPVRRVASAAGEVGDEFETDNESQLSQLASRRAKAKRQMQSAELAAPNDTNWSTTMTSVTSLYDSEESKTLSNINNVNNNYYNMANYSGTATSSKVARYNNYSQLGKIIMPAVNLALDHINKNGSILRSYKLAIVPEDTQCNATISLKKFFDLVYEKPKKMLLYGDACRVSTDPIAKASYFFDLIQISYADTDPMYTVENYPNFFRVIPSENALSSARIPFIRHFNWTRVGTIYQNLPRYSLPHGKLLTDLEKYNITIKQSVSLPGSIDGLQNRDLGDELRKLKDKDVRIILGNFDDQWALYLFCEAYREKMTGRKYLWLLTGISEDKLWSTYEQNRSITGCSKSELLVAMDGYIITDITPITRSQKPTISGLMAHEFSEEYQRRAQEMGINIDDNKFYGYVYDGIWAIALALDRVDNILKTFQKWRRSNRNYNLNPEMLNLNSLSDFDYSKPIWANLIRNALNKTRFDGVTGTVRFEKHERPGLITFSQFQPSLDAQNEVVVASYDALEDQLDLQVGYPISWRGPLPPIDYTIQRVTPFRINRTIFVIISIFAVLGIILAIIFLTINIKFRNQRYIKMSSPYLNNLIIVGCILTYTSVIILGLDSGLTSEYNFPYICNARAWVLMAGFTLAFGSMFSKTFRVHSIFTNIKLHKKVIKDYKLFMVVFILLTFDVCILIVWQYFDPFYRETNNGTSIQDSENEDVIIVPEMEHCQSQRMTIFLSIIYVYKGLLMAFGCFLAWETRHVSIPALNDSKYIGLSVYNVVIMCVIGAGLSFALRDQQDASFVIISIFIIFCSTTTLCLVFVPKVRMLIELKQNPKAADQRVRATLKTFAKNYRDGGAIGTIPANCRDIHGNIIHGRTIGVDLNEKIRNLQEDNTKQRTVLRDKTFELEALSYKYRKMISMIQSGQYVQALNTTAGGAEKAQQIALFSNRQQLVPAPTIINLTSLQTQQQKQVPSPSVDPNKTIPTARNQTMASPLQGAVARNVVDTVNNRNSTKSPSPTTLTNGVKTTTTSSGINTNTDLTIDTTTLLSNKITSSLLTYTQSGADLSSSGLAGMGYMTTDKVCCAELQRSSDIKQDYDNSMNSKRWSVKQSAGDKTIPAKIQRRRLEHDPAHRHKKYSNSMAGPKSSIGGAGKTSRDSEDERASCPDIAGVNRDNQLKRVQSNLCMSTELGKRSATAAQLPRALSMIEYLGESKLDVANKGSQRKSVMRCCCHQHSTYSCCEPSNGGDSTWISTYGDDVGAAHGSSSELINHRGNFESDSQLTCSSCCQSYESLTYRTYDDQCDDFTNTGGSMTSLAQSSCDSRRSGSNRSDLYSHQHSHQRLSNVSQSSASPRSSRSSESSLRSNSSLVVDQPTDQVQSAKRIRQQAAFQHQVRFAQQQSRFIQAASRQEMASGGTIPSSCMAQTASSTAPTCSALTMELNSKYNAGNSNTTLCTTSRICCPRAIKESANEAFLAIEETQQCDLPSVPAPSDDEDSDHLMIKCDIIENL